MGKAWIRYRLGANHQLSLNIRLAFKWLTLKNTSKSLDDYRNK